MEVATTGVFIIQRLTPGGKEQPIRSELIEHLVQAIGRHRKALLASGDNAGQSAVLDETA